VKTDSKGTIVSRIYPWLSILMALAPALFEWVFFFQGANWEGHSGPFAPDRLGFNLAWVTLLYLIFPASHDSPRGRVARPFHWRAGWDGLRSEFHLL
jgi:hypothetical protein